MPLHHHAEICMPLAGAGAAQPAYEAGPYALNSTPSPDDDDRLSPWLIQDEGFADIDTGAMKLPLLAGGGEGEGWRRPVREPGSCRA